MTTVVDFFVKKKPVVIKITLKMSVNEIILYLLHLSTVKLNSEK